MSTLKPFFVELTMNAVVMAENWAEAERWAENNTHQIFSDNLSMATSSVELTSIEHLRRQDNGWDADCTAYGPGSPRISDVLPEADPVVDTKTIDMFAQTEGGAA